MRLQNSSPGVREAGNANISGNMIASRFFGDGSGLTNVGAANLAPGTYAGAYNFTNPANRFCGDGSCLTNLAAANLAGVVPDANLPTNLARLITTNTVSDPMTAFRISQTGSGVAGIFGITSAANTQEVLALNHGGFGLGLKVRLTNASNSASAIDVHNTGNGPGVYSSASGSAIWGVTVQISSAGVLGDNTPGEAVVGRTAGNVGVGAVVGRNDGIGGYGVRGFCTRDDSIGVLGQAGISGSKNFAGRFENVNAANDRNVVEIVQQQSATGLALNVTGNAAVSGNLSKGGGSFKIDHPLNPENQYLYHSFVESPDMKNIYDGVVELNQNGEAWVTMPKWFQALNAEFRYQLTCIGGFANVYIAEEMANNKFKVAGGRPGLKVSWQVTGTRIDPYANKHRIPLEEWKSPEDRGSYLHPDAYNLPPNRAIGYREAFEGGGGRLTSDRPAGSR
ncbi:MAG TPA: hypothetical protein PLH94_09005 [Fimbriimonadaceae bacterium]|nr:hypothetical protein [Fimbriimonadaceae bacterium]